ncbi:unnamed protein product [Staurois parvus]|uniref:Mos1 transposase HTH domain-containing protein n=1 Tax=Staurois parvus TaxID=386267 RepID=A0ABN9DZC6_9NEOB|nr:unnamed protein product [Staurois parvus]
MKFCVKLGTSATFYITQQVYGDAAISRSRCSEWHMHFKSGRRLEDDERSGRPSTSSTPKNVETIQQLVHDDRWRTIHNIAAIVVVSYRTVQAILTCGLNMRHVPVKFIPRLLTQEQKEHHIKVCQEL